MRAAILAASLALPLIAVPAAAQSTGTVDVNGSVADRCLFTTPSAVIALGEISLAGSGAGAGRLDPSRIDNQTRDLVGWCNGTAATMTVEAHPLLNLDYGGAPVAGFDTRVDYLATAVANSASATDSSTMASPGAGSPVNVGLFSGNVRVSLSQSSTPGNGLLVAGNYGGMVIVVLAPNFSFGGD
ncbi:MAG: hypothetical protein MT490_11710 [Sphingomonas sp.]|uniref:hypothetical protein n=1 Tax=Sphingomonas sp. TaxID=28214 RepID=UPI0022754737|nr:hypothetical protein [Sphingomonas sp.]MCX8476452.1 hypothetical protein [Sphingomonas sp.]